MTTPPRVPLGLLALGAAFLTMGCDPSVLGKAPVLEAQVPPAAAPELVAHRPAAPASPAVRPTRPGVYDPGEDGRLSLREFYQQKYPEAERNAVRSTLAEVLPNMSAADLDEATAEILAYHHVVYHRTRMHDLEKNHAVLRRIEPKLRDAAAKFDVPVLPLMAIVSWENSGDLTQISWANAAGLGQMTWGAVERSHSFAAEEAARLKAEADALRTTDPTRAAELDARIRQYDVAARHKKLQASMKIQDERMIVEANLEDAALFFKYLMQCYGDRADLAISAYHNGVLNNDDILYDYLLRQGETISYPGEDRTEFIQALARRNMTYLDLWRDTKSRQMLNGLRTVEGEVTNGSNADMALGDESDIYPWKVLASLAALQAGPAHTAATVARYGDRWDLVEVKGLPEHTNFTAFEKAIEAEHLVKTGTPLHDLGIGGRSPEGTRGRKYSYYVTPELDGYLASLTARLREATGKPDLKVPVSNLSSASGLGSKAPACPGGEAGTHLKGVAVDIVPGALEPEQQKALESLLWADYLMDRIYLNRHAGAHHVVLNPRRGDDYLQAQVKRHAE